MMFKLLTVIVPNGQCDAISQAAKAAGAPGGTIIPGRGTARKKRGRSGRLHHSRKRNGP